PGRVGNYRRCCPDARHRSKYAVSQTQAVWTLGLPRYEFLMALSFRIRTHLALLPLLLLLAIIGGTAVFLLHRLAGRIDAILRDNYDSVLYMERLKESLERIDSSYTFALAGQEQKAREQYQQQWPSYDKYLALENQNITLPGEQSLADRLTALSKRYRKHG